MPWNLLCLLNQLLVEILENNSLMLWISGIHFVLIELNLKEPVMQRSLSKWNTPNPFISILICFKTDPLHKQKMVEESLTKLFQALNFHETASSDLIFDCITKIIAKQVSIKNKVSVICVLLISNAS